MKMAKPQQSIFLSGLWTYTWRSYTTNVLWKISTIRATLLIFEVAYTANLYAMAKRIMNDHHQQSSRLRHCITKKTSFFCN